MKIIHNVKRLRKELILLSVTILICLFIFEISARLYYFKPIALIPWYGASVYGLSGKAYSFVECSNNSDIIYQLRPNLDSYSRLSVFRTNSQGLRDKEYDIRKPNNTYRVIVLGDSFTIPGGVNIEDAYHSILESYYNDKDKSKKYEFINFGVEGYTLNQYLATLKYRALKYSPDTVLVGIFLGNDIPVKEEKITRCIPQRKDEPNPYFRLWSLALIDNIKTIRDEGFMKPRKINDNKPYDLEKLDSLITEFKDLSLRYNISITFVSLNNNPNLYKAEFEIFNNAVKRHNLSMIDTSYLFIGNSKDINIYRYDSHPNAYSNKLFAKAIEESSFLSNIT